MGKIFTLFTTTSKNLLINETIPISFQIKGRKIKRLCFIYGKSKINTFCRWDLFYNTHKFATEIMPRGSIYDLTEKQPHNTDSRRLI